jgi:hypothetical protein
MALSDHEQTVLKQMEVALRAGTARSTPARSNTARPPANRGSGHYLAAAIGLFLAGVMGTAVGLWLADDLGTGLGVLGFLLIVGSGRSATHLLIPLRGWMTTRKGESAKSPR